MSEFHENRASGIGGSDVPALVGMDAYGRTALDIWREKTGRIKQDDTKIKSPWLDRGIRLEPVVRDMFEAHTGLKVQRSQFRRNKRWTWMVGHPDGIIVRPKGILEIKHAALRLFADVKENGIPWHWQLQWQHYAMLTGMKQGYFAVLNAERWELLCIPMKADQKMWNALNSIERKFWEENVVKDKPPVPETVEIPLPDPDEPVWGSQAITQVEEEEFATAVNDYQQAQELAETVKVLKKTARDRLAEHMPVPGAYEGGGARVYLNQMPGKKSFDFKTLEKLKPLDPVSVALILAGYKIDTSLADRLAKEAALDLDSLKKQGQPYKTVKVYPIREDQDVRQREGSSN